MINRYFGNTGKVVRVNENRPGRPPANTPPHRGAEKPPDGGSNSAGFSGLKNLFGGILPKGPDFIIMLIVLGYDVLKESQLLSGLSGLSGLFGLSP